MTREIRYDLSRRPVQPAAGLWVYDSTGLIDISAGFTDINFDTEGYKDSDFFTFSAGNAPITILKAGVYEISYYIGTDVNGTTSRQLTQTRIMLDTGGGYAVIPGTRGQMYNRQSGNGYASTSLGILYSLSANDLIKIQAGQLSGGDTVVTSPDACGLVVKAFLPD